MRRVLVTSVLAAVVASAALVASGGQAIASSPARHPVGNEIDGFVADDGAPNSMPAGIVNGACTPSADHPYPVILVHGTLANEAFTWQALAPMLANAGYCVFGLNYGANADTADSQDHFYGLDYIQNSAAQLAAFVRKVLAWTTEASGGRPGRVDIVGHSQGGMMPRYYIEHSWDCSHITVNAYGESQCARDATGTSGASTVHMLMGLAPSNHGADAYGVVPLFEAAFGSETWTVPEEAGCPSCGEQEAGNPFLTALNGPDGSLEAVPGVLYYVMDSAYDELVTPAPNPVTAALGEWPSAFLHGPADQVMNIELQSQCPTDTTDHIGIAYDPVALYDVMHELLDNATTIDAIPPPDCPLLVPPVVSG